ncbi:MAG: phosphate signaling complex protein PhoU [Prevotella sp.]|jgi:phosphate transport system protein|nr:phosphate signaling complex protein PhoU [Prevotella sp.]
MTTNIKLRQLELLLNDFELLSKTALIQMQITTKLLEDNSLESLYEEAESNEIIMDRLEIKVREEVVFTIFQFNPIAADLRKIITYQDITTNLERIGDMLLNIIHFLKKTDLSAHHFEGVKRLIAKMVEYAGEMLRNAVFSFSNEDAHTAYQVIQEDDKVDELFHQISLSLQETLSGKALSKPEIQSIIHINAISHNLERIGDSATNIAEATIYLTEGKDIRHGNKQ